MKYVTTERFIVSSNTSEAQKKYRDNYDTVFRQDAPEEEKFACEDCGALRTRAQGGTVFTVCDACWDKHAQDHAPDCESVATDGAACNCDP